jgi:hypothetical protein
MRRKQCIHLEEFFFVLKLKNKLEFFTVGLEEVALDVNRR